MSVQEISLSCQQASSTFCSLKRMLGQKIVNMATMQQCMSDFYNTIKQTGVFVPDYWAKYYKISRTSSSWIASQSTYVDRYILYAKGCCRVLQLIPNVYTLPRLA